MLVELTAVTGLTCLLSGFHRPKNQQACEREREVFYILCPASSLMDVPGYVSPDKLMNVPMGFERL